MGRHFNRLARVQMRDLWGAILACSQAGARIFLPTILLGGFLVGPAGASGDTSTKPPVAQIDLAALGYGGLSAAARQSGGSNLSVDFLDGQHILLTFNPKKLFKRLPECPPTHADRLIHAVVLEVPSGKVIQDTDWYLHDLRRYVWNLGEGRVLVRRMNRLYEVNARLEERQILDSPIDLLWVSVTPDGKQIIVETSAGSGAASDPRDPKNDAKNKERVKVAFLDSKSLVVQRSIEVRGRINLEGTSSGVADVRKAGGNWLVEFGSVNIARVKARRAPNLLYSSANSLLIGRCTVSREGYNLSAFTVTGSFLWRQHWDECRYSPVARDSEDGSRSAVGTLTIKSAEPADGENSQEGLEQHVQVVDTATGKSILVTGAAPAAPSGQNFALSPEGRRLAVIVDQAVHIYELPEMSAEDRARYVAVKSDTPNLSVPPAETSAKGGDGDPVYTSSTGVEMTAEESAPVVAKADSATPPGTIREETPTLTIRTGTQVVALDVVVTDSSGRLIKGLQQSDFRVSEDGKPQNVSYFKEFGDPQPRVPAAATAPKAPALPPNVFSNYLQPTETGAATVVLLDLLNTPMADQIYAQDQLVKFLKNKPKDAKFALCILGNELQMIQGFTDNNEVLLRAAKGKKASRRQRPYQATDGPISVELEAGRESARFNSKLDFLVESIAQQESELRLMDADKRMLVTVDAFAHLARYLTGIPGRKNLVWLSGSFLLGIYPESNGQNPFLESHTYGDNLKKVANLLGDAHVAVYPVDVRGLQTDPLFSAANNNLAPITMKPPLRKPTPGAKVTGSAVANAVMNDQLDQFSLSQTDEHSTMTQLATQTGGQAFFNTNGIEKAIRTAAEQGSNYYALSYTPANKKYDGGFRKIHVTLAGKKYHLAYRSGYYAMDPFAPTKPSKDLVAGLARAAMQQGSPQSRQILFGARVVPIGKPRVVQESVAVTAKTSKKRKVKDPPPEMQRYGIDHAVSFSDLRFNPGSDGAYHDVVNFMVTVFDSEGKLMASELSQTVADLKPEVMKDIMAGGLRIHQEIEVPVKSVAMRLGVEDVSNSHIGTLEIPLPVPAPPEGMGGARRAMPAVEPD